MLVLWFFIYLFLGGVEWFLGVWEFDCIDYVGLVGLRIGRRVGGVEVLFLFMMLFVKFRFVI